MSGGKRPRITTEELEPSAEPIPAKEEGDAKKRVRKRAKHTGRESTILSTRMMGERSNTSVLHVRLSGT